jgi:hypothetical protein
MNGCAGAALRLCALFLLMTGSTFGAIEEAWTPIFDGMTLNGWHVSSQTGHGTGGEWLVRDGAIVGTQDRPGNGGIVLTDKAYGDFEICLEMNNDYGPDSGLFLRSTETGKAYQAMIDYHAKGNLMGIYGEGLGGFGARNYQLLQTPDQIKTMEYKPWPCPLTPQQWKKLWKHGQWNEFRARIEGNPPRIQTWINGVKFMDWTDTRKRLPDTGLIGLQVHGGGDLTGQFVRYRKMRVRRVGLPDNALTDAEQKAGWQLLFDGKTLDGWMTSSEQPSKHSVEEASIQPHGCGGYMMIHKEQWGDFVLSLDFKISKGCNSGIFLRTFPLTPRPGLDVGFNGLEIAIDDTTGAGYHDTGAIYDLVKPRKNAMRPAGEWNHAVVTCNKNLIDVELNGEKITHMDLDEWTTPKKRPDGSDHKFPTAWKDHRRKGYIGLQDHGRPVWFKNIKLLPLNRN